MKAIDTNWRGYRFRSRLEARWAVFFDGIGVDWDYEVEGFDLGGEAGWYLPDFWLPGVCGGMYVEVKPKRSPWLFAATKTIRLAQETQRCVFLAVGDPLSVIDRLRLCESDNERGSWWWSPNSRSLEEDHHTALSLSFGFCLCPTCGRIGVGILGIGTYICRRPGCLPGHKLLNAGRPFDDRTFDSPIFVDAATKARSARFEHGEAPA